MYNDYKLLEQEFLQWGNENHLQIEPLQNHVFSCGNMVFLLLDEKEGNVCDSEYHFILDAFETKVLNDNNPKIDAVAYKWGTRFCYTKVDVMDQPDNDNVREFKYLGKTTFETPGLPFLGVHGQYEILNGSRNYSDWVAKAKFLDISTLGICEKNTLAGTMAFQEACKKREIKPILGETITIQSKSDLFVEGKIYALTEEGWRNVLFVNSQINVVNPSQYVTEECLLEHASGVAFVFDPLSFSYDSETVKKYQEKFDLCYFKLDTVEFNSNKTDKLLLTRTQEYFNNKEELNPILICDAYYLDKDDYEIKKDLNLISGVKSNISKNQYFKADDENLVLLSDLFKDEDFGDGVSIAMGSLLELDEKADFSIQTGKFKLPKYKMTPEEVEKYGTADEMFDSLCMEGWERLHISDKPNLDVYLDRLQEEIDVIRTGGYIDYFLILYDIIKWCRANDILVGEGRGSSAGCLCAYLLNITKVDPIEYGLLFERFLNKGRIFKTYEYEVVKIQLDKNLYIELDSKEKVIIFRQSERLIVPAKDLQKDDKIIGLKSGNIEEMLQRTDAAS